MIPGIILIVTALFLLFLVITGRLAAYVKAPKKAQPL